MRCKVAQLSPKNGIEWENGQNLAASSWRSQDWRSIGGWLRRDVYHYDTLMASFQCWGDGSIWTLTFANTGWGSVSDQHGMNQILVGTPYRYRRDGKGGGPRIVEVL